MFTANNDSESDLKNIIFATAKADLYFSERREKRFDQLIVLGIGMVIAIFSSLFALWAQSRFGG